MALDDNARDFEELLGQAQTFIGRGKPGLAAVYAQAAADSAWQNHAGFFASPPLETAVSALAEGVHPPRGNDRWSPNPRLDRRLLHVLTQAYPTGGHTRLVSNWIRMDRQSAHAVVLTGQRGLRLPQFLSATSNPCFQLDRHAEKALSRAATLRGLAASSDLVVLHHHPCDIVPGLAFTHFTPDVPVVTMNHADHVYWAGTSISHVVASVRASGQQLAIERRGIEASRSAILPIPLEAESRTLSPTSAKERLGLASDAFVLLTMAAAYKYRPIAGVGFLDIVEPWLLGHPRAVLIAVGPVPRGAWSQAAMRTGGRVRALGRRTDVALYFESADVYLDSYPLGSLTSALQAGMRAIPLLTYACRPPEARILGADSPGLDRVMLQPTTPDAYADSLTALYDDPVLREHLGNETAASITRWHTGQGWRDACDRVYDLAATIGTSPPSPVTVSHGYTTLDDLLCEMGGGNGIVDVLTRQLPFMTLGARLSTWYALTKRNAHPGARQVLPEAILRVLRLFRSMRVGRRG